MPPSKDFFARVRVAVDMMQVCHSCWSLGFRRVVDTMQKCDKCLQGLTTMLTECVAEQLGREAMERCPKCNPKLGQS